MTSRHSLPIIAVSSLLMIGGWVAARRPSAMLESAPASESSVQKAAVAQQVADAKPVSQPSTAHQVSAGGKFTGTALNGKPKLSSLSPEGLKAKLMEVLKLVKTSAAEFKLGDVVLDAEKRTLTFPAMVEMTEGQLEYALVHETGKAHEALFTTQVPPQDLHIAALLLNGPDARPEVEVVWETNGPQARRKLSELINVRGGEPGLLKQADWRYLGSQFEPAGFAAQTEGSCISLIADAQALMSPALDPLKLGDELFTPNPSQLPPKGSIVHIVIHFPPSAS